jgi:hypothetical protein
MDLTQPGSGQRPLLDAICQLIGALSEGEICELSAGRDAGRGDSPILIRALTPAGCP